ncbi:hypothetical protein A2U01_0061783, partial [Trifolium medium]|nr:hypothetical protein [Trifolium medium]
AFPPNTKAGIAKLSPPSSNTLPLAERLPFRIDQLSKPIYEQPVQAHR